MDEAESDADEGGRRGVLLAPARPLGDGDHGVMLRSWRAADAGFLADAWSHHDIGGQSTVPGSGSVDDAAQWIAASDERPSVDLAVVDPTAPDVVWGEVGLAPLSLRAGQQSRDEVETGWWVLPAHRGRGVATAAVSLLLAWAFAEDGSGRVIARIGRDNPASEAVARSSGFERLGRAGDGRDLWLARPRPR